MIGDFVNKPTHRQQDTMEHQDIIEEISSLVSAGAENGLAITTTDAIGILIISKLDSIDATLSCL
jgi:hypothetical protein